MSSSSAIILGIVSSVIAALIVGLLKLSNNIFFQYFINRMLWIKRCTDLTGVYDCEYYIHWKPEGQNIIFERIFLFRAFGDRYYGYLINNPENDRYRKLPNPGLRLQGELFMNRYLIGWWKHPLPDDNTCGAFNICINLDGGQSHEGQWNGESSTYHRIKEGRWVWKKNSNAHYGVCKLLSEVYRGK